MQQRKSPPWDHAGRAQLSTEFTEVVVRKGKLELADAVAELGAGESALGRRA